MTALDSWHWTGTGVFKGPELVGLVLSKPINDAPWEGTRFPESWYPERFPGEADLRAKLSAADALDREELERLLAVTRKNREVGKP